jgi:hypothetical protein
MRPTLIPALGALLLCASFGLQAQPAPAGVRVDCSKAADPKACEARQQLREERAQRRRDMFKNSAQICKTRPAAEQRDCMRTEMCREARDPARCEEYAKKNAERRDKVLEACKGKQGAVLRQCMREEYKKLPPLK